MKEIPKEEMIFNPLSFGDPNGRLFRWNEQLYRAIKPEVAGFYRDLLSNGTIQKLTGHGLVETEVTDLEIDGHGLILKHREIPVVSYPPEWCAAMLKDASLVTLDLMKNLADENLMLQDAHPWNILFDGTKPVFVDLGSIIPIGSSSHWVAADEFRRFFLHPLMLMAEGHGRVARWLLHDYDQGVLQSEAIALSRIARRCFRPSRFREGVVRMGRQIVPLGLKGFLKERLRGAKAVVRRNTSPSQCMRQETDHLRSLVEELPMADTRTEWSDYDRDCFPSFTPTAQWTPKHTSVQNVISTLQPSTLLDLGSNRGWFSQLAARQGVCVIASDVDEPAITKLYHDARAEHLGILPILLDFKYPEPGFGLRNEMFAPAIKRFRSDMVMALALVHHLVFKHRLNFEQIIAGLSPFVGRHLLVEFIAPEDRYVREWNPERFPWYSLGRFQAVLKREYSSITPFPSNLEHRTLLLCERQAFET